MYDYKNTYTLLASVKELPPLHTFLLDRYFPTSARDIFTTDEVIVEYKKGLKKAAPFVAPRHGGVAVLREGYKLRSFAPAHTGVKRSLTIDDLKVRGFGEALYPNLTPEQREGALLLEDLDDMRGMIARREEAMAAEVIFTNGCVMHEYADDLGTYQEREVRYYDEQTNPGIYTPAADWTTTEASGIQIINDIHAMISMNARRGLPATELLCAPDVMDVILNNAHIQKLLDNRRMEFGGIAPEELPSGVTKFARLNIKGRMIDFLCYEDTYLDVDGQEKAYVPTGKVALGAAGAGRTVYGAITQLEQTDGEFHTYAAQAVPKYLSDAVGNTRTVELNSAPLCIPNNESPFIVATAIQ